jgi:hypothetical protein
MDRRKRRPLNQREYIVLLFHLSVCTPMRDKLNNSKLVYFIMQTITLCNDATRSSERYRESIRSFENVHISIPWDGGAECYDCGAEPCGRLSRASILCVGNSNQ